MDEPSNQRWFLRKHEDGSVFGPLSFEQLTRWASAAQISPQDTVSSDQETSIKAPMLTQLGMDWLVEITSEHYYGRPRSARSRNSSGLAKSTKKLL